MCKFVVGIIVGAVILFLVFVNIGAYREVIANAKTIKQLKEKCHYEYERGYGAGFTAAEKDTNILNKEERQKQIEDVRDNIHGEWEYDCVSDMFRCSQCGDYMVRNVYAYCPWCGADMWGEEKC